MGIGGALGVGECEEAGVMLGVPVVARWPVNFENSAFALRLVDAGGPVNFEKSAFALILVNGGEPVVVRRPMEAEGPVDFENSAFALRLVDTGGPVVVRGPVNLSGLGGIEGLVVVRSGVGEFREALERKEAGVTVGNF